MTTSVIRAQLHSCLDAVGDKKLKAIYVLVEDDIASNLADNSAHWNDPSFVAEMDRRVAEMESGVDKGRSWEEVKNSIRQEMKSK
jgi:putative addiction module component (TIGR02574 family)